MNDPGFDSRIAADAKVIENEKQSDEQDEAEEDEQAFLAPSRWWFASTAFPLVAGTFGPMASAFSICALAIHWRVYVPSGSNEAFGTYIDDPGWLIGINAAQLAIALISNLFLLLNMAKSVRFSVSQPIIIVGWYISSFALIGLLAGAAGPLRNQSDPDTVFSQAFYYAIFSAGLYFICASLMLTTVIGAYLGHCDKEFKLTMSQRTLMLQTISFLVYLLVGSVIYSHIEGWYFLDAVYWADYTLLTVGIGDISPSTDLGRGLLFPFAIGGIIILGLLIGSIRSLVLERGKIKLGARLLEKERERLIRKVKKKKGHLLNPISSNRSKASQSPEGDDDGCTERERREKEFKMMRKVQENAAARRRWTALAISATTWFSLWFVGAVVFQAAESNAQQWSYYEGLYFSYTSLLTIGYGDLVPKSNAGKPFFVFWSLLAIPSLTILISNMGDTIVKVIRNFTLWIGTVTVLPNEHGVGTSAKLTIQRITHNKFLGSNVEEKPPGILGELDAEGDNEGGEGSGTKDHHRKNDPEGTAQRAASNQADIEAKKAKEEGKTGDEHAIPKSKHHYHAMLIKEISSVMRHLNSSPPRKYSFDEWAWYLKLVGEDESDSQMHRKAVHKPTREGKEESLGIATGRKLDEEKQIKWSWVGNRSPLMGNKEEAEWVLERLTKTLERGLEAMRREEEGKGDWAPGGKMEGKEPLRRNHYGENKGARDGKDEEKGRPESKTVKGDSRIDSSRTLTQEPESGDEVKEESD